MNTTTATHVDLITAYGELVKNPLLAYKVEKDGKISPLNINRNIDILPGNFNPLHDGHKALYKCTYGSSFYQFSISRPNGTSLTISQVDRCLAQFRNYGRVILTNTSNFMELVSVILKHTSYRDPDIYMGFDEAIELIKEYKSGLGALRMRMKVAERDGKGIPDLPTDLGLHYYQASYFTPVDTSGAMLRKLGKIVY